MNSMLCALAFLFGSPPAGGGGCDAVADLAVTVTPNPAAPGQVVTIKLSNQGSACTYAVSFCLAVFVREHDCDGPLVDFNPCVFPTEVQLGPGESFTSPWAATGSGGAPLPAGHYAIPIAVWNPAVGGAWTVCAELDLGHPANCPTLAFGAGKPGSAGIVPRVTTVGGPAVLGNAAFRLRVDRAPEGTQGLLLIGAAPGSLSAPWGTLLVDLAQPYLAVPIALADSFFIGQPFADVPLPIPNQPALAGIQAHAQALLADAGAAHGISHTAGLTATVCP